MKILVKIAPIIVILACAASLYFSNQLKTEKTQLKADTAKLSSDLASTQNNLKDTTAKLDQTTTQMKQTSEDLDKTKADLASTQVQIASKSREIDDKTAEVGKLKEELTSANDGKAKAEEALQNVKDALTRVGVTDVSDIAAVQAKISGLTEANKALDGEKSVLADKVKKLETEVEELKTTPPGLRGKVVLAKSMWNFIVIDIGQNERVRPNTDFLVYRDSKLVGKARVTAVNPSSSVADLDPAFTTTTVKEGDSVVHEKM